MQILYLELYRVQAFKVIKLCGDEARSGRSTNEIWPVIYERAANRCHGDESKAIVNSRLNLHTRSDIVPWHGDKKPRCGYLLLGTMKYIRGTEYCFTSAIDHRDCRTSSQFLFQNQDAYIIFPIFYHFHTQISQSQRENKIFIEYIYLYIQKKSLYIIIFLENNYAKKIFFFFLRKWRVHVHVIPNWTSFIWFGIMDGYCSNNLATIVSHLRNFM